MEFIGVFPILYVTWSPSCTIRTYRELIMMYEMYKMVYCRGETLRALEQTKFFFFLFMLDLLIA